jgi:hypothetical protein
MSYDDDDHHDYDDDSVLFRYQSACQQRVAYNRRALKAYITKARLRLELKL